MTQTQKFTVVATEPTPNPAAFKFGLGARVIANGSKAFNNEEEAESDPFAKVMFSFGCVDFLYIQDRFVSVTLTSADEWELLFDPIIQTIEEHLTFYGDPNAEDKSKSSILKDVDLEKFMEFSDDLKAQIIDAYMDEGVRPALAQDGGGVVLQEVENDVVRIQYQGACGSCSKSQSGTLAAIQSLLQKNVHPDLHVTVAGYQSPY